MNGEEAFVETLKSLAGTGDDLGDDCAILDGEPPLLATVDSLNESIHFESSISPADIASKLVGVNVSDVAAMGGKPRWALLAEGSNDDRDRRERFVRELTERLREGKIKLVGGDIAGVGSDNNRFYSMTLLGEAHPDGILRRKAAIPGDRVAVTGTLGAPAAVRNTSDTPWNEEEREWLYDPPNRVTEGRQLVEAGVRCAIDLSDGLLKDLGRVLRESEVGARLDWTAVPTAPLAEERSEGPAERLEWNLAGGEDFELLFTIPEDVRVPFDHYTVIGEITDGDGIDWDPPLPEPLNESENGYDHLKETR